MATLNFNIPIQLKSLGVLFIFLLFLPLTSLQAQEISLVKITGTVTDASDNKFLSYVAAVIGDKGVYTDDFGKYEIEGTVGSTIIFSSIGYNTKKVVIADEKVINIILEPSATLLQEAMIIGYGTTTKKEVTGATATIKSRDFNKGVFTDAMGLLQGKVAGLTILNPNGADPLATFKIILRGTNTLTSGQGPLIIIDGVAGGDLRNINFEEVESFDVLKDGAAAAIYGTRGTNGVIIITTKRARSGRAVIEFSSQVIAQVNPRRVKSLDAQEFKYSIENFVPSRTSSLLGAETDWFSEITRKMPLSQRYSLAISGGAEHFSHRTTLNTEQNEGLLKDNEVKKYLFKTNIKQSAFDDLLSIDYNLSVRSSTYSPANYNLFFQAFTHNPTQPVYDPSNVAAGGYSQRQAIDYYNPVASLNERVRSGSTTVIAPNATATLKLFEGITWNNFISYELGTSKESSYKTKYFPSIIGRGGEAELNNSDVFNLQYESTVGYKKSFKNHSLNAIAGYSYQKNGGTSSYIVNSNFDTDIYGPNNIGAGFNLREGNAEIGSYRYESKLIAFFGRVMYNYSDKYLASVSIRREGSSKFGDNNKWGIFPAVSLGWRINQEKFMEKVSWIDELKLRVGYGVTGNQDFSPYRSQVLFGRAGRFYYNGEWINTYQPVTNPNPDLRWEKKEEINIGIDFSIFKRRLGGSLDLYSRTSKDLLYSYNVSVPPYLYNQLFTNVGDINNRGIELSLNGLIMKRKDFEWNGILTYSTNVNKLVKISNEEFKETSYDVGWLGGSVPLFSQKVREGSSLGTFYGPVWLGVDESGFDRLKNANPVGAVNPENWEDIGSAYPIAIIGITNAFTYKDWGLNFAMRSNIGGKVLNMYRLYHENWSAIGTKNIISTQLDNPEFTGITQYSSKYLESATFLKLDNVSFTYKVPTKIKYISSMDLSLSAQNVFILTKYKGLDPEVNLSGLEPGIESLSYYPRTTTIAFGINVIF